MQEQAANPRTVWDDILAELQRIGDNTDGPPWVDAHSILDEYSVTPNGTSVTLVPNIDRPAIINSMILSIPAGTAGLLTIGTPGTGADRRQIGIVPGQAPFSNIGMIIYPADTFVLTITGGQGVVSIEIMGGYLRRTSWRSI